MYPDSNSNSIYIPNFDAIDIHIGVIKGPLFGWRLDTATGKIEFKKIDEEQEPTPIIVCEVKDE